MARQAVRNILKVEMTGQHPKLVDQFVGRPFTYVITVCDRAAETCPVFPGDTERLHWGYDDPASVVGTEAEQQRAFDNIARQLVAKMRVWLSLPVFREAMNASAERRS